MTDHNTPIIDSAVENLNLPEAEDLYGVVDMFEDAVVIIDKQWRYVYVNELGAHILRAEKSEIIGVSIWDLIPEIVGSQFEATARRAMRDKVRTDVEEFYPHRQEYYHTIIYPTPHHLILRFSDTTDIVRAKQLSQQLMGDLQGAMEVYWSDSNRKIREKQQKRAT